MVRVEFLGPIGLKSQDFDVKDFHELRDRLQQIEGLKEWLEISAIALNDVLITSLDTPLKDGDKIVILPPVCGG